MNQKLNGIDQIFVGIDLHNNSWHVTVMSFDQELWSVNMPASWKVLEKALRPFSEIKVTAAYEA